jgi:phage terminase large subunit-like protein
MEHEITKDYVQIAINYANEAIKDKKGKKHGLLIRQAAQRFLDDLKRAKQKDSLFIFDEWHANDPCDFIEKLPHVEGKWETPTIVLHSSHVFFIVQLFGFRKKESSFINGYGEFHPRRFTSALFAVARKNAKSLLSSSILNYCLCCEPEPGAQVISAATTFGQASIIFNAAKRQIEMTPDLREAFGLECWAKAISRVETGSSFKPVHAKASTQDGLNPSHVALDEIHAHKTPDLLNVLTSAAGARSNPLWLYTTTEGYINPGPWGEIRMFAKRLLSGVFGVTADHFLAVFYAVDEENKTLGIKADDEFDEASWIKANPLMDVNPHLKTSIQKEAIEAKQMPSKLAEFRIKRLNRQAATADGWIDLTKWNECSGIIDIEQLKDVECYGGLDLASTSDITAFRLIWRIGGKIITMGWRWVPEAAVLYRTERGTVPYAGWCESGLIKKTPGNVIDYDIIFDDIIHINEQFKIKQIAYDRWNATDLVNRLVGEDLPLIEFIQGPKSYHPAMQELERYYMAGNLVHGGDPLLAWCASNLVARRDANLNMAPDKKNSADKIDDMSALLMAVGISVQPVEDEKKYQVFFV